MVVALNVTNLCGKVINVWNMTMLIYAYVIGYWGNIYGCWIMSLQVEVIQASDIIMSWATVAEFTVAE